MPAGITSKGVTMAVKNEIKNCVIGEGSVFEGRFYVNGSIQIEGKFEGDIKTDDQLTVGTTGKVKTDILAKRVTIAGTLIGNITATEEVNLIQSGKVLGNITTPKLNVEEGVVTQGTVKITAGTRDPIGKLIQDSFGEGVDKIFSSIGKPEGREKTREKKQNEP